MPPFSKKVSSFCYDAVLLVDMQTDFVRLLRKGSLNKLLPNQIAVIRQCAAFDIPVVVLEYEKCGITIPKLMREVKKVPRFVSVTKKLDSGFSKKELSVQLMRWKCRKLLLTGINAEFCVLSTATDALRSGYSIVTSPQLIAGRPQHAKDDCISWYAKNGSIISI